MTVQLMSAPARRVNNVWLCGDCGSPCTEGLWGVVRPMAAVDCTKCGRSDVPFPEPDSEGAA
jgi:hypothetical protein